jgi:type VI protein secretion system component VasK
MSNEERNVEREVRTGPGYVQREEVRETGPVHVVRESNTAAWWVAALVALIAVVGLVWMFNADRQQTADIAAAREAGRAEAMMDVSAAQAQSAALAAQEASRSTTESLARATEQAAADAAAASREAAQEARAAAANVSEAAQDAAAEVSASVPPEPVE